MSTVSSTNQEFFPILANIYPWASTDGTGPQFSSIDQTMGFNEMVAAAMDTASFGSGGFEIHHLLKARQPTTAVRLELGRVDGFRSVQLAWLREGCNNGGDFDLTDAYDHEVVCLPQYSSIFVAAAEVGGGEACLELSTTASAESLNTAVETGRYQNSCSIPPINAMVELPSGVTLWEVQVGRTERNGIFNGLSLKENYFARVWLTVKPSDC
ncbi:unnamed protein product [Cylindrotheca closterium]|uniref:Uncharacterized protein n=1 Tax=Cylindrotheca closterium TaxID=2856 RepID=A0AAD2FCC0_9STRA|nr:unnamed protein product [Cylindrotheca closterium]